MSPLLTDAQHAILRAALDRIIPPDDGFPGATDASVDRYLLGQFERGLSASLPMYQNGLEALDAEAEAAQNKPFVDLPADAQDALLARIEEGEVAVLHAWSYAPEHFFSELIRHAAEGFYSDPGNGSNRDGVAWKMIDFTVDR